MGSLNADRGLAEAPLEAVDHGLAGVELLLSIRGKAERDPPKAMVRHLLKARELASDSGHLQNLC